MTRIMVEQHQLSDRRRVGEVRRRPPGRMPPADPGFVFLFGKAGIVNHDIRARYEPRQSLIEPPRRRLGVSDVADAREASRLGRSSGRRTATRGCDRDVYGLAEYRHPTG